MTPPPNLPAGLKNAIRAAIEPPFGSGEADLHPIIRESMEARILTALSPFWPGQGAEWAREAATAIADQLMRVTQETWEKSSVAKDPRWAAALATDRQDYIRCFTAIIAKHAPRTDGDGAGDKARIDWLEQCNNIAIDHAKWADHMPLAGQPIIHLCEMDDDCAEVIQEIATAPTLRAAIDAAMIAPTQPDSNKERT